MSWFKRNGTPPTGRRDDGVAVGLHSRETFLRLLDHERARCDRNGRQFALVVFDLAQAPGNGAAHRHLVGVLSTRLRRTDACGCLDVERVAAILPDTELDPAWTVANDVHRATLEMLPGLTCAVYAYPSVWWAHDDRRGDSPKSHPDLHGGNGNGGGQYLPVSAVFDPAERKAERRPHAMSHPEHVRKSLTRDTRPPAPGQPAAREGLPERLQALLSKPVPRWKRVMDVAGAATALVLVSPVMVLTTLAVRLTSPGPVLFTQRRVGKDGRVFTFWKFRSMAAGAGERKAELADRNEQTWPAFKIRRDRA